MNLIDKCLLKFFGYIDDLASIIESLIFPKPKKKVFTIKGKKYVLKKRKQRKCKDCHCNCHCKDEFHTHHWDKDVCVCDACAC